MRALSALFLVALLAGCDKRSPPPTPTPTSTSTSTSTSSGTATSTFDRERPIRAPRDYDPKKPTPLVIALHGRGGSGAELTTGFELEALADAKGFLLSTPNGTFEGRARVWDATNACCKFRAPHVDDVAFVSSIINLAGSRYNVDPKRVYVIGYSNGGFMAHRLACDLSTRIAAIASLAGATWEDDTKCSPGAKVAILEVHGTKDDIVPYGGGPSRLFPTGPRMPSAQETVESWVKKNGCRALQPAGKIDVDAQIAGDETAVLRAACPAGGAVELWSVAEATHHLGLAGSGMAAVYDFLAAHPKP